MTLDIEQAADKGPAPHCAHGETCGSWHSALNACLPRWLSRGYSLPTQGVDMALDVKKWRLSSAKCRGIANKLAPGQLYGPAVSDAQNAKSIWKIVEWLTLECGGELGPLDSMDKSREAMSQHLDRLAVIRVGDRLRQAALAAGYKPEEPT